MTGLSHAVIFVIVCSLFGWKRIFAGFLYLFVYIFTLYGDAIIRVGWAGSH